MRQLRNLSGRAAFVVAVFSVVYGIGDQISWWDRLSGRSACTRALERLWSQHGYPTTFIYRGEEDFSALERMLLEKSVSPEIALLKNAKATVSAITRGEVSFPLRVPQQYPIQRYIPEVSPVLMIIGDIGEDGKSIKGKAAYAASLAEIRRWIDEGKSNERFWVSTILVGVLSALVALIQMQPTGEKHVQ